MGFRRIMDSNISWKDIFLIDYTFSSKKDIIRALETETLDVRASAVADARKYGDADLINEGVKLVAPKYNELRQKLLDLLSKRPGVRVWDRFTSKKRFCRRRI